MRQKEQFLGLPSTHADVVGNIPDMLKACRLRLLHNIS